MTSTTSTPASAPASAPEPHLRPAGQATRAAIEAAARDLFAEHGFTDTSVRAIAARADVDPALVVRHFGSKEALFLATITTSSRLAELIEGPLESLGRRLVEHALSKAGADTRRTTVALMQASHRPHVREEMQRVGDRIFLTPLFERMTGEDREARAAMVWAQFSGLVNTLALADDPVLRRHHDVVVTWYGDAMQRLLTP